MARRTQTAAMRAAVFEEMRRDDRIIVMGEDVRRGVVGYTAGLADEFGPDRVRDTPISESTFIGAGLGAAATGLVPIVDLLMSTFLYVAMDPDPQPGRETPLHDGRCLRLPVYDHRRDRWWCRHGGPTLREPAPPDHELGGREDRPAVHSRGCERSAEGRDPRPESGRRALPRGARGSAGRRARRRGLSSCRWERAACSTRGPTSRSPRSA